jgi:hypothetical protein
MQRINIITFSLIALWFIAAMTAPMMFADPQPEDYLFLANTVSALFLFPILIAIVYMFKRWSFFGFHPFLFGPTLIAFSLVGYFGVGVFNFSYMVWKGVDPYGYTQVNHVVLYAGQPMKEIDPKSFVLVPGLVEVDAKDKKSFYLRGQRVKSVE